MHKIKLLFVVTDFYQAGAERFMYEIDRALDKNKFQVTILSLGESANPNNHWKQRHYEPKHRALGSTIEFIDSFYKKGLLHKFEKRIMKKISRKPQPARPDINHFLENHDLIHWMGEYTFFHNLSEKNFNKSLVHVMSAKFQNPELYRLFDTQKKYRIISGFDEEECIYEFSEFEHYTHWRIPLLLRIPFAQNPWSFQNTKILKIGIFTRLNVYKPLDPFFYSFQLLLEQLPQCELHIFGNGDPEKEGMNNYLRRLGIMDKVFFRGHQEDLVATVTSEHINLSWFQGYNNDRPAGYAGFDICATGTPLICWDFLEKPVKPFNRIYPHYKSLSAFVRKSAEILTDKDKAETLSALQFSDVLDNRDISREIIKLETIYNDVLKQGT